MAVSDIVFDNQPLSFVNEIEEGALNAPSDILFRNETILEVGPTYPDVDIIADAIWAHENRTLTA